MYLADLNENWNSCTVPWLILSRALVENRKAGNQATVIKSDFQPPEDEMTPRQMASKNRDQCLVCGWIWDKER